MNYVIHSVKSKSLIRAFHRLPFTIYKNDDNWVPHVKQEVEAVFDPEANRYFTHGKCERWIMQNEKQEVIGRIAAFVNEKKAFTFDQPTGGIGFFECINDKAAAAKLFETAENWLAGKGMEAADGPINFGENNKYWGLLIENFDYPAYHGQNYNPLYYVSFFEENGYKVYYNQVITSRKIDQDLPNKNKKKASSIIEDELFHIETIKKNQLDKYAEDFRTVYNEAWVTHDNFKAMSAKMARSLFRKMKPITDEDLVTFVYYNNRPIAFNLAIPDINPIIKKIKGNLNLWGKLKFLLFKRIVKLKRANGIAFGVTTAFQGKGVEAAIFEDLVDRLRNHPHYNTAISNWIGDFNPKMLHIIEGVGFRPTSKLATYRKLFDPTKEFKRSPIIE